MIPKQSSCCLKGTLLWVENLGNLLRNKVGTQTGSFSRRDFRQKLNRAEEGTERGARE